MKKYILLTILLLSITIVKAITYPTNWGTDRIFLYDFWEQCGQPAGVNWGDVTKNIAELNFISVTHPDNAVEPNFYKVSKVYGSDKGFVGQIPAGIENLTELEVFQLNNNTELTGVIPACFATFQKLDYLNLKNCNFTGMAAPLTQLPRTQLELQYNRIPYGDLLPMKSLARTAPGANAWSYDYLPQYTDLKVSSKTRSIASGVSLSLDIDVLLPNHGGTTFKWYRNDVEVGTGKIYAVTMSNLTTGDYQCEITTDADMLNAATCPASNWVDARTAVYPQWAITNKTEKISVTLASATTDYFRSKVTGNWNTAGSWESSTTGTSNWITATLVPESSAAGIAILNGHSITLNTNAVVSSLTINSGATLELSAAKQLSINTALTNNGILTLKSDDGVGTATIITTGTVVGSGTTNVEQFVSSAAIGATGRNWYISSPLSAATSSTITDATGNGLVYYNGSGWISAGATMDIMKGYIAKSPNGNKTIQFTGGSLNTGNKSVSNLALGYNLVGNPYPSYLDWSQATKSNVSTSIWYRSKSSGSYVFQTYNVSGAGVGVNGGTNIIPPMQSFWIKTTNATNSLGFTNDMRSHQNQSIDDNRLKASSINTQKLLRLEVANGTDKDQTVVYFDQNALNTFDQYDSQKMFNEVAGAPEIYTFSDNKNLVINGFNSIQLNAEIPLGFRTGNTDENVNFNLKALQVLNFGTETELVLIDKGNLNTETVLNESSEYTFKSTAVNSANRFSLVFRAKGNTTGGLGYSIFENKIQIQKIYNNQLVIKCDNDLLKNAIVTIYNTAGHKLNEQVVSSTNTAIYTTLKAGMYIVKLQSKGKAYNAKLVM